MIFLSITLLILVIAIFFWQLSLLLATIFGSPTVYANKKAITDSLKLLDLKRGELLVDLGCGDARSLILAAKNYGARGLGVERSPYCVLRARLKVFMAGESQKIKIVFGDFRRIERDLQQADAVYLYLLNSTLKKMENWFFGSIGEKTRVVSLAFWFPKHRPVIKIETCNLGKKAVARLYRKQ